MTEEENIRLQAVHIFTECNKRVPKIKADFDDIDAMVDYVMGREASKKAGRSSTDKILARSGLGGK